MNNSLLSGSTNQSPNCLATTKMVQTCPDPKSDESPKRNSGSEIKNNSSKGKGCNLKLAWRKITFRACKTDCASETVKVQHICKMGVSFLGDTLNVWNPCFFPLNRKNGILKTRQTHIPVLCVPKKCKAVGGKDSMTCI